MRTSLCLLAFAIGAGVGGCRREPPPPPPAEGSATGSAAAGSAAGATIPGAIALFVNDLAIGSVQPSLIASWPRLDALVPGDARKLGTWELVSLQGAGPAPHDVPKPSSAFPDMVPALFPGEGGAPAFGMFDPVELARKGAPAMREDHVTAIRIKVAQGGGRGQNDDGGASAGDPTKLAVAIKTPAGTTTLTGDKLLALPREAMPGNPDQKGWRLSALLAAAGVTKFDRLILSDASGANLTLDKADVSDTSVPFIKLNKQGALRLRVLKKTGDGWNPAGDLRALAAIEAK